MQSTFRHARRLRRRGLAASPPCTPIVVNKKNCPTSMICVTILRLVVFLFCMTSSPKMQGQPRLLDQGGRCRATTRKQHPPRHFGHAFRQDEPRRDSSWVRSQAGALLFDETPRALFELRHCRYVAAHQRPAGKMGWIQPFGIGWVDLRGWKRIGRIVAIPCPALRFHVSS